LNVIFKVIGYLSMKLTPKRVPLPFIVPAPIPICFSVPSHSAPCFWGVGYRE
jgi:hypothetical protein